MNLWSRAQRQPLACWGSNPWPFLSVALGEGWEYVQCPVGQESQLVCVLCPLPAVQRHGPLHSSRGLFRGTWPPQASTSQSLQKDNIPFP